MRRNKNAAPVVGHRNGGGSDTAGGCIVIPMSVVYHQRSGKARNICMIDIFNEVKHRVPVRDAAELYGYHPNRAGFICCPLHGEKTPSMKLYPGEGGFHCFGCGAGGSVIDFVTKVFGLDPMAAVRRLDQDFHLALPLDRPPSQEERNQAKHRQEIADTRKLFQGWRERTLNQLNNAYRVGHLALKDKHPDAWTDAELMAVKWMPALEAWSDALDYGDMEAQMLVFRDRRGVERLCSQILDSMPEKSATA